MARILAYIGSSPGIGGTSSRTSLNSSKNFSGITHLVSSCPAPDGGGKLGIFDQSIVCIWLLNLLSGYIVICEMIGWTACVSSGVDSLKTRGITAPVLVLA